MLDVDVTQILARAFGILNIFVGFLLWGFVGVKDSAARKVLNPVKHHFKDKLFSPGVNWGDDRNDGVELLHKSHFLFIWQLRGH